MPLLEVDSVDVFYGDFQAVSGISLSLSAGEVLALIGANGAGKTTLLRAVTGLLAPRAGRIRFDGDDVTGLPAEALARRGVAMVPEGRMLFPSLTVEENLQMGTLVVEEIYRTFDRIRGVDLAIVLVEQDVARARAVSDQLTCLLKGQVTLQGASPGITLPQVTAAYFGE